MAIWDSEGFNSYMAATDPGGAYLKTLMPKPQYITTPNKDTSVPMVQPNQPISALSVATPAAPPSKGFNWTDPNFLNLLAGIGVGLDPNGPGGAIGKATIGYNKSKAAQQVAEKTLAGPAELKASLTSDEKAQLAHQVSELLTEPGKQGITSMKRKPDGSLDINYDTQTKPEQTSVTVADQVQTTLSPYLPPSRSQSQLSNNDQNSIPSDFAQLDRELSHPDSRRSLPVPSLNTKLTMDSSPIEVKKAIIERSQRLGLNPVNMLNLIDQESNSNPRVTGGEYPGNLGQFTTGTAKDRNLDIIRLASDPDYNLNESLRYISDLKKRFGGDERKAILAYNGGGDPNYEKNVNSHTAKNQQVLQSLSSQTHIASNALSLEESSKRLNTSEDMETIPEVNVQAKRNIEEDELHTLNNFISDTKKMTRSVGLTAKDLAGLDPKEVDTVVRTAQNQQLLSIEIAKVIGESTEKVRTRIANNQKDLVKLRLEAVKNVQKSTLNAQQREKLLNQISTAVLPEEVEGIERIIAKFPTLESAGIDRDAIASERFYGARYYQLKPEDQAIVNRMVDQRLITGKEVVATDTEVFVVDKKTGTYRSATPEVSNTPTASNAPSQIVSNVGTAPKSSDDPTLTNEEFTKTISEIPQEPKPGIYSRKSSMNENQGKAFGYGSRALQAHSIATKLESDPANKARIGTDISHFLNRVENLDPKTVIGTSGTLGAGVFAAKNVSEIIQQIGAQQGAILSSGAGTLIGIGRALRGATVGAALATGLGLAVATFAEPFATKFRTPEEKQYAQAQLDFISAVLRRESGAAILASEYISEGKRFFPQLNDDPQTIKQKELARRQVLNTLRAEAGRKLLPPIIQ